MKSINRYAKRSKISEAKFRQMIRYFAVDLDATQITQLIVLNLNSVNHSLRTIRERIAEFCEAQSPFKGEIEVDESSLAHAYNGLGWLQYKNGLIWG
jgi:hypothetical protein